MPQFLWRLNYAEKFTHYDMVLSGWWEASNDSLSVAIISEQFLEENKELLKSTYAVDHELQVLLFQMLY